MVLTSCSGDNQDMFEKDELVIIFISHEKMVSGSSTYNYDMFAKQFNKIHNENIRIVPMFFPSKEVLFDINFSEQIKSIEEGGIVIMPVDYFNFLSSGRNEYFESLDAFITNNNILNSLPKTVLEFGKNPNDNNTWCLLNSYASTIRLRAYNKQALNYLGINAPQSLSEFTDSLYLYKSEYQGKPPIMLFDNYDSNLFIQVSDIFSYYGIQNPQTITFDVKTNQFRNILDYPETISALKYLKELYDDGVIQVNKNSSNNSIIIKHIIDGDIFTGVTDVLASSRHLSKIEYENIEQKENSYINCRPSVEYVAVLLKGTTEKHKKMNKFIELFISDSETHISASAGFDNINFIYKNGLRIVNYNVEAPELCFNDYYGWRDTLYSENPNANPIIELAESYFSDNFLMQPYYLYYEDLNRFEYVHTNLFSDVFEKLFSNDSDIEELIIEYKELCEIYEIEKLINDANIKLQNTILD